MKVSFVRRLWVLCKKAGKGKVEGRSSVVTFSNVLYICYVILKSRKQRQKKRTSEFQNIITQLDERKMYIVKHRWRNSRAPWKSIYLVLHALFFLSKRFKNYKKKKKAYWMFMASRPDTAVILRGLQNILLSCYRSLTNAFN